MRIIYAITKTERGGAQAHVLSLALRAREAGFAVTVVTGPGGFLTDRLKEAGIETREIGSLRRSFNPLAALTFAVRLRRLAREIGADIVHCHSSNTAFASLLLPPGGPASLFTVHGLSLLHPGWRKSRIMKAAYRLAMQACLPRFRRVIFVCRHDAEFAERSGLVRAERAVVIPNGLDTGLQPAPPESARAALFRLAGTEDAGQAAFGTVSRLEYAKGLDRLIRAVALAKSRGLSSFLLFLAGDGPERKSLGRLIKKTKTGDIVRLIGPTDNPLGLIPAFRALFLPSRLEGFPIVLLEAGLAGVPAVAAPVGGVPELIADGEDGFLAASESDLADRLIALSSDPEKAAAAGARMREKVLREFSDRTMADRTFAAYAETA